MISDPLSPAPGPVLQYTLWSHDELLGRTDLGAPGDDSDQQTGVFQPEPPFERIEPLLSALQSAMSEFVTDAPLPAPDELAGIPKAEQLRLLRQALGRNSTVRRVVETQRAVDAFALHLRDEHDREVPTQFITIHRLPADVAAGGDHAPGQPSAPRYVIVARMDAESAR
jgi:hypothetical protein